MSEARPLASLSAGLLARKGQARPAMRPQSGNGLDDLGWNDMGPGGSPLLVPVPAYAGPQPEAANEGAASAAPGPLLTEAAVEAAVADVRGKAAFTLRLDAERHLRLRLACVLRNRSAQQIVTEALDAYLKTLPDLETAARTFPADAPRRRRTKRGMES